MALLAFEEESHTKHTRLRAGYGVASEGHQGSRKRTTDDTDYTDGSEYDESGCPRKHPLPQGSGD